MKRPNEFWWREIDAESGDFGKIFPSLTIEPCPQFPAGISQPNPLIWDWDLGLDYAAYAYELARRASRKPELRPYPKLTIEESEFLFATFAHGKDRKEYGVCIRCLNPDEAPRSRPGYSQAAIWKLDAPTKTLLKEFEKFLKRQRVAHGVTPRKKAGTVSAPPPWKQIELLDGQSDYIAERQALDRIKKLSSKFLARFKSCRQKQIEANPNLRACLWPELHKLR